MISAFRLMNCITPPHLLRKLLESDDLDIREAALSTLLSNARLRGERAVRASLAGAVASPTSGRRTIFDCQNRTYLPSAVLARSEDGPESADSSVNRAFDGLGTTRQFYRDIHGRDSIDDRGMRLDGYVTAAGTTTTRSGTASRWYSAMETGGSSPISPDRSM
jgi:hypothetical protein